MSGEHYSSCLTHIPYYPYQSASVLTQRAYTHLGKRERERENIHLLPLLLLPFVSLSSFGLGLCIRIRLVTGRHLLQRLHLLPQLPPSTSKHKSQSHQHKHTYIYVYVDHTYQSSFGLVNGDFVLRDVTSPNSNGLSEGSVWPSRGGDNSLSFL